MEQNNLREVYELKCEICGKVVTSLNENQADYNMKAHKLSHKRKKEVK